MTFDELKEKARSLPLKPGVYIMQDAQSTVIYVGKAKALKNRVSQYFQDSASHTEKTRAMVSQIDHFDVIIADSEFEALVLENSLIKRHQPRYNRLPPQPPHRLLPTSSQRLRSQPLRLRHPQAQLHRKSLSPLPCRHPPHHRQASES